MALRVTAGDAPDAREARTGPPCERVTTSAAVAAKAATAASCHATRDDIIVSPSGDGQPVILIFNPNRPFWLDLSCVLWAILWQ